MAGIQFDARLETRHVTDGMKKIQNSVRQTADEIKASGLSIEQHLNNIKSAAAAAFAGFSAKQFISQMVQVRGEFQQLEVAFKTMLGSEEKAIALMDQLTKTAAITPFDLQGVTQGAKQLLAYGISADKVNDTLIHLGDIAAGLSLPLGDLVYLYGTTMTQGRMFTQDLRQFMGRGIPIAEELAKQFGVTKDKVGELVTAGKVGAEEFSKAIMAMSTGGGKFAGLMEAQSKTITGRISNIEDAIDTMFNDMGKQSEGIINGTLGVVSALVENYETVGKVIADLVATYGVYKAAVITVTAIQGLQTAGVGALTAAETVHYGWLVLCEKAQALLNKTMLANPYVLAATAIAGLVAIMVTMKNQQDLVNEAQDEYNRKKEDTIANEQKHMDKLNELIRIAGDESLSTDTRKEAMLKLKAEYPELFKKYNTEIEALKDIAYWKAKIAEIESGKSITLAKNELEDVNRQIAELESKAARVVKATTNVYNHQTLQWEKKTVTMPSLSREEQARLTMLQSRRDELNREQKKAADIAYLKDLTGVSNEDLQKQISERKNLIARIEMQERDGKKNIKGRVYQGGVTGVYNKAELQDQLQTMEWEQNRRKKVLEDSTKDFVAEANKAYKKEQAALKKLESLTDPKKRAKSKEVIDGKKVSEMSGDEFLAAVQKQQAAVSEAKKKVDAYKSKADNKAGTDDAKRRQKLFETEQDNMERLAGQRRLLEDALVDAEVAGIASDAEREIREREIQHERKIQQIIDQADDWKKEAYKVAEERFNATNRDKSKTFADTEEGKAGWQKQTLTDEQQATIEAQVAAENKTYERALAERHKQQLQSMRDYLKEYGSFQQQKLAIALDYAEKIKQAEEEGDMWKAERLRQQQERDTSAARMEDIKNSMDWEGLFNSLDKYSADYLLTIRKQLQDILNDPNLQPADRKVIAEKITDVDNMRNEKRENTFSWINDYLVEQKRLQEEAAAAAERYNEALKEQKEANEGLSGQRQAVGDIINEIGGEDRFENMFPDPSKLDFSDMSKVFDDLGIDKTTEQGKKLEEAFKKLSEAEAKASTATQKLTKAEGEKTNAEEKTKIALKDQVSGFLGGLNDNIQKYLGDLPELLNELGFGEASRKLQQGLDGMNDVAGAAEEFAKGNYVGAALKGISAVKNIGSAIGVIGGQDNHEEQLAIQEEISNRIEKSNYYLSKIEDNLSKSYGTKAIEESEKYQAQLDKNRADMVKGLDAALWDNYGGGHVDYWHWNKNTSELAKQMAEKYGLSYGGDWQSLFLGNDATKIAEMLAEIRDSETEWWRILTEQGYNGGQVEKWLEMLADTVQQQKDHEEKLKEQLTGTTFDNVFSDAMNALYEFADGSEDVFDDVADNWQKMVNKMVLNNIVGNEMRTKLEKWYKKFSKTDPNDKNAIEDLRKEYNETMQWGADQVKGLRAMGVASELESSEKSTASASVEKISSEQADLLVSIGRGLQIESGQQSNIGRQIVANIQAMQALVSSQGGVFSEMRSLMVTGNEHLLAIKKSNQAVLEYLQSEMPSLRSEIRKLN